MPSRKVVVTRTPGWCDGDFAHPSRIDVGDRVAVITYFPSDENVRDFGALALHRYRRCSWCVDRDEAERKRRADAPEPPIDQRTAGAAA